METKRGTGDHRDMLTHEENSPQRSEEAAFYEKPAWMLDAPVVRSNAPLLSNLPPYIVHNTHTPSLASYTVKPAPYSEDGLSVFHRDGHLVGDKTAAIVEALKPGQKRNGVRPSGTDSRLLSRDEDPLWNFKRRTAIRGPEGELETEFRSRGGGEDETVAPNRYTPSASPPIRTPTKSAYQEQCDQIWHRSDPRRRKHPGSSPSESEAAGKSTANSVGFDPLTGLDVGRTYSSLIGKGGGGRRSGGVREEARRWREIEEARPSHFPPWATYDGNEEASPMACG